VSVISAQNAPPDDKPIPEWATEMMTATGVGIPPDQTYGDEAKIASERAGKVEALRNLAEKIYGVKISANTTLNDFIKDRDEVKAVTDVFIASAEVTDTRYLSDGSVEVDVACNLRPLWEILKVFRNE